MKEFVIAGKHGFVRIELVDLLSHAEDVTINEDTYYVEIKSGSYYSKGTFLSSYNNLDEFYQQLEKYYCEPEAEAKLHTLDSNLMLVVKNMDGNQFSIVGVYNESQFKIKSDQTFLASSIQGMKQFMRNMQQ
ncbi:hypothetical protein [Bacillus massiliigorillae]|uniref:hypothetical protein n=1 Tax=Bacillus massiliigorillae TaxID=1243664 RepID=UPI0003A671A9|nr:hypothetical protein [Bacillus massiliigorillae]